MPIRPEIERRATHLGRSMKAGLSSLWVVIAAAVVIVGGDVAITIAWGVRHLIWGLILFLMVLIFVIGEGSYQVARRREADHAEQLAAAKKELPVLEAASRQEAAVPSGVNPRAVWKAVCHESGTDRRALTFGLEHRFDNAGAFLAFGAVRCTVTDPDGITTSATGKGRYYQYTQDFFQGAPPVRPGLYRFEWEGQLSTGTWVDLTHADYEVQAPPKTGLEVVIDDEKPTRFPGVALILEIEYHVTNHDPVPHILRPRLRGLNPTPLPSASDPEFIKVLREEEAIRGRRRGDWLPRRVQPGETVRGVYVDTFPWDPTGTFPDYTLIIKDDRHAYPARPHGASEDPLAAWPIS